MKAPWPVRLRSIRASLLLWLGLGLSGAILLAGVVVYYQSREAANTLFDYQMRQIVASMPREPFAPIPLNLMPDAYRQNIDDNIVIQMWDNTGVVIYQSHANIRLPEQVELGFADIVNAGKVWRVYSAVLGNTVVEAAQPQSARLALAASMAIRTVWPLLLLFPLIALLIWFGIAHALRPVSRVTAEVQERDAHSLQPLYDQDLPREIRPLTHALNALLERLGHSIEVQRTFVADAAHALRTPITALRLQSQLVQKSQSESERAAALVDLTTGIDRVTRLLQQLLTLARQEPGAVDQPLIAMNLSTTLSDLVSDMVPLAAVRQVDLGIVSLDEATILGNADALAIMFQNVLDNALKYSPAGSMVDVSLHCKQGAALVRVQDYGGGIPEPDLTRVFNRFYQSQSNTSHGVRGSGLGLAIVQHIAAVHAANVWLENKDGGLCVNIQFPTIKSELIS